MNIILRALGRHKWILCCEITGSHLGFTFFNKEYGERTGGTKEATKNELDKRTQSAERRQPTEWKNTCKPGMW